MVIGDRQQLASRSAAIASRPRLALRAMPIAAAIIGDDFVGAVLAARDMPAEGCRGQLSIADITFNWPRLA